jgi:hypothetical protein
MAGGRGPVNAFGPALLDRDPRGGGLSRAMRSLPAMLLVAASAASAQGLDRDTLLTDAAAVPPKGTVRVAGVGVATQQTDSSSSSFTGTIGWTPVENLHADVGAYFQSGEQGPSARVRYQFLNQLSHGLDMSGGIRFKTVGFHPDQGEVEFIVAAGRRFGHIELVLNGVFGVETGGENGKDAEAKAFAGWRFNDAVRAGIDFRMQAEVGDEEQALAPPPPGTPSVRDYDLTVGPTISWLVTRAVQVQALVGLAQPKKTNVTSAIGAVYASFDF